MSRAFPDILSEFRGETLRGAIVWCMKQKIKTVELLDGRRIDASLAAHVLMRDLEDWAKEAFRKERTE